MTLHPFPAGESFSLHINNDLKLFLKLIDMSRLLHHDGLEDEAGHFVKVLRHGIDLIFTRLQLLEGEIAIGTHAGVVEGDVVTTRRM